MTKILTILLLIFTLSTYGQKCDTIDGKFINCVDSSGLKQGYWELTKKKILVSGHSGLGSKEGCRYFEKAEYYPLSKGKYKNDKKIGTWDYYSGDHLVSLDRKVTYYEDGSVKDENLTDLYELEITSDTLNVNGYFYHDLDTMSVNCQTQTCSIRLSDGQELMNFEFSDMDKLEFELLRLKIGVYNRKIKMKKNAR